MTACDESQRLRHVTAPRIGLLSRQFENRIQTSHPQTEVRVAQVLAECITKVRDVHMLEEFGSPEAIWEFEVMDFPAVVTMDSHGQSLHKDILAKSGDVLAELS